MSAPCCQVPGNSDIAGIGVRVAVYIQAILVVINTFLAQSNDNAVNQPEDSPNKTKEGAASDDVYVHHTTARLRTTLGRVLDKFSSIIRSKVGKTADRALERSLFVTGWALVISALIEAYSKKGSASGLSDYHASIVLNLSFVNYWAGYNLLRRRTNHTALHRMVIRAFFKGQKNSENDANQDDPEHNEDEGDKEPFGTWIIFYIHASIFSALGILFWIDRSTFLRYTHIQNPDPCQPSVVYWAFRPIPLTSRPLKGISLTFYCLSAIPIVSGYVTQAISIFAAGVSMCVIVIVTLPLVLALVLISIPIICIGLCFHFPSSEKHRDHIGRDFMKRAFKRLARLLHEFRVFHWHATTLIYTGPIIYWIVATEMLVRSNTASVREDVERQWTFGQVMALFMACMTIEFYTAQVTGDDPDEQDGEEEEEEEEEGDGDEDEEATICTQSDQHTLAPSSLRHDIRHELRLNHSDK